MGREALCPSRVRGTGISDSDVIDLLSQDFEDEGRYPDVENPVATTWVISFEQVRKRDPLAAEYLSFVACVDAKDIPQSLLPPGASRKMEIDALRGYSLNIARRSADSAITIDGPCFENRAVWRPVLPHVY